MSFGHIGRDWKVCGNWRPGNPPLTLGYKLSKRDPELVVWDRSSRIAQGIGVWRCAHFTMDKASLLEVSMDSKECLQPSQEFKDRFCEANAARGLGNVRLGEGRLDEAIAACEQSREIFSDQKDQLWEAHARRSTGVVYQAQGRWDAAAAAYGQSPQTYNEIKDHCGAAHAHFNLATLYDSQDKIEMAVACARAAVVEYGLAGAAADQEHAEILVAHLEQKLAADCTD